jgi:hypothetical protein
MLNQAILAIRFGLVSSLFAASNQLNRIAVALSSKAEAEEKIDENYPCPRFLIQKSYEEYLGGHHIRVVFPTVEDYELYLHEIYPRMSDKLSDCGSFAGPDECGLLIWNRNSYEVFVALKETVLEELKIYETLIVEY